MDAESEVLVYFLDAFDLIAHHILEKYLFLLSCPLIASLLSRSKSHGHCNVKLWGTQSIRQTEHKNWQVTQGNSPPLQNPIRYR